MTKRASREQITALAVSILAGFALFAWLAAPRHDRSPATPAFSAETGLPGAATTDARPPGRVPALQEQALDAQRPLPERVTAVRRLSRIAEDPQGLLSVMDRISPADPQATSLRATLITALASHADDDRVRERWLASLRPTCPQAERCLVLTTIASLPRAAWALDRVQPLLRDADPAVRRKAAWALRRIKE